MFAGVPNNFHGRCIVTQVALGYPAVIVHDDEAGPNELEQG